MRTTLGVCITAILMATVVPAGAVTVDFVDVGPNSVFLDDIEWLAVAQITKGCNPPANDKFCPDDPVTRGQMAAFMVRAFGLTGPNNDTFVDDDTSVFEDDIEKLALSGITRGCNPPTNDAFCPDSPVTRGQMAAFMARALDLPPATGDAFNDDDTSVFEDDIERLAKSGITRGCNPPTNDSYCPEDLVTREQMAAFIRRALELGIDGRLTLVRAIDASVYPSVDPTSVVFIEETEQLVLLDAAAEEEPGFSGFNAWVLDRLGDVERQWSTLDFTTEPSGGAWDAQRNELLISDDEQKLVFVLDGGPDGKLGTNDDSVVRYFSTGSFGGDDAEGLALDPTTGQLFIINGKDFSSPRILRVSPGANGVLDGVPPEGDDTVTTVDVKSLGITNPEGGTFDAESGTLLVVDRDTPGTVFELTRDGALVQQFGISTTGADLAGIEIGTSSYSALRRSLYLVDRGERGTADGVVFEFRYD